MSIRKVQEKGCWYKGSWESEESVDAQRARMGTESAGTNCRDLPPREGYIPSEPRAQMGRGH